MKVLTVSATLGIVTPRIGSRAVTSAAWLRDGVVCINNRWWGTEFNL
jgi:hypothetical protein